MRREATSEPSSNSQFELLFETRGSRSPASAIPAHRRQLSMDPSGLESDFEPIPSRVRPAASETVLLFAPRARSASSASVSPVVTIDHEISPEILERAQNEFDVGRFHIGLQRQRSGPRSPPVPAASGV
jgi:hypothetical protein